MNPADTEVFTANVPRALADKVDQLAARTARSRGSVITQALAGWIEQEEQFDRQTWEALADVRAGKVVEHAAVQNWVEQVAR